MKTYFFETYGCEMNIAESAAVEQLFIARGWKKSESAQTADVAVINTCSIRETAENRILGRLGWFSGLKAVRECKLGAKTKMLEEAVEYVKDGAKPLTLIVMGCMAERLLQSFQKDYPFIDYVVGTYAKHHFAEIISAIEEGRKPYQIDDSEQYRFASLSAEPGAFSTFVPIMHGCNNFCTYCIVPYVRGRELSRPVNEILNELDLLGKMKVREVTLIGQNVNSYNSEGVNFAALLQKIADHLRETSSPVKWVRFMSSHPKDFSDDVIDVIAREPVICRHIHLPVQNGSTAVLKAMNRRYTREQYLDLVGRIKARIPEVSLTTDIMMGFPGETEADVEDTLDLMRQVKYESAMMYFYNPREGTPAAKMEQLPEELVNERFNRVLEVVRESCSEVSARFEGCTKEVLVETENDHMNGYLTGRMDNNITVHFKGDKKLIGSIVDVKLTEAKGFYYIGELIK